MSKIGVIDLETTGVPAAANHRIVELAVVVVHPHRSIESVESVFESLFNPERDVGATDTHGLTARDLKDAPPFRELAWRVVETLRGCVALAGHNVEFDISFLKSEFRRLGTEFPSCPLLDTHELAGGGKLETCCAEHDIELDGPAHYAIHDARATARLLLRILRDRADELCRLSGLRPIEWPTFKQTAAVPLTRTEARARRSPTAEHADAHADDGPPLTREELSGKTVCFTGFNDKRGNQSRCSLRGNPMNEERAWDLAVACGMKVSKRMTKRDVDILVVADRYTESRKALDARKWGKRIIHEPDFWRMLGLPGVERSGN